MSNASKKLYAASKSAKAWDATPRQKKRVAEDRFRMAKRMENDFLRSLNQVVRQIDNIIKGFVHSGDIKNPREIVQMLENYAQLITPWAKNLSNKMISEVSRKNLKAWNTQGDDIGRALRKELGIETNTGFVFAKLLNEQVDLIKSLPLEAAIRVHKLTSEALITSARPKEIAAEILKTGEVTKSRATLIARTEVARTSSKLTEARSEELGITHYYWRTSKDGDVRHSHKEMDGKIIAWAEPPTLSDGTITHAGQIYNCFTGDTVLDLLNGCQNLWRTAYNGPITDIESGGVVCSVTPNHPILTSRGWIPAGEINIGDEVIQMPINTIDGINQNINQTEITFNDIFFAFKNTMQKTSGAKFNFHGHIPNSDVEHIRTDDFLTNNGVTEKFKALCNFAFANPNCRIVQYIGMDSGNHIFNSLLSSETNKFSSFNSGQFSHSQEISFAASASNDIITNQNLSNSTPTNFELLCQSKLADSPQIFINNEFFRKVCKFIMSSRNSLRDYDSSSPELLAQNIRVNTNPSSNIDKQFSSEYRRSRVTNVQFRDYFGHVYTIQSDNGWYGVTPAKIIAQNCRCYPEPIIPE